MDGDAGWGSLFMIDAAVVVGSLGGYEVVTHVIGKARSESRLVGWYAFRLGGITKYLLLVSVY